MALTLVTSDLIHGLDYSKLTGTITTWNQDTTGNAATATLAAGATILATARNIGGVSFNGSAAIDLPGVNTAGNQNTSGNAATATLADEATILANTRTINGVAFNGSTNITIADSTKLPLAGGTLTGNLEFASGSFINMPWASDIRTMWQRYYSTTYFQRISSDGSLRKLRLESNGAYGNASIVLDGQSGNTVTTTITSNDIILAAANVGIGITSPSAKLHVVGKGLFTDDIQLTQTSPRIDYGNSTAGALRFWSVDENSEKMRITSGGLVGIGTTSPFNTTNNTGLNVDTGGHSSIMIGDGINDGGMIQSSDSSQRIIIGANVYDDPYSSWQRWNGTGAALIDVYGEGGAAFISLNVDNGSSGFPSAKLFVKGDGNVGIGTTSPSAKFDVRGAVAVGRAYEDGAVTVSLNGGSDVQGGTLEMTQGWTGTMSSGDTVVFTYNAVSWKSWILEYKFASTNGLTSGEIGGYNNNGDGNSNTTHNNSHGMSIGKSRVGQSNIITFTFTSLGTHPFCHFKYYQSGGDGAPTAARASITLNS